MAAEQIRYDAEDTRNVTRCANEPESLSEPKSVDEQFLQDGVLGTRTEQYVSDGLVVHVVHHTLGAVLFEQWTERRMF